MRSSLSRQGLAFAGLLLLMQRGDAPPRSRSGWDGPAAQEMVPSAGLRDGDLVFRKGRDLLAGVVLAGSEGEARFSHVGMVVHSGGVAMVIHAMPADGRFQGGVILETLEEFTAAEVASSAEAARFDSMSAAQGEVAAAAALALLGRPFDARFGMDGEAYYCSSLVMRSWIIAGVDLRQQVRPVVVPLISVPVFTPDALRRTPGMRPLLPPPRPIGPGSK